MRVFCCLFLTAVSLVCFNGTEFSKLFFKYIWMEEVEKVADVKQG